MRELRCPLFLGVRPRWVFLCWLCSASWCALFTSSARVRTLPRTRPLSLFLDLGARRRLARATTAARAAATLPWRPPPAVTPITPASIEPSFGNSIMNNRFFQTPPPAEGDENHYQNIGGSAMRSKPGPFAPWGNGGRPDPLDVGWRTDTAAGPQHSFVMTGLGKDGAGGDGDSGHMLPGSKLPASGSEYVDTWYPEVPGGPKFQVCMVRSSVGVALAWMSCCCVRRAACCVRRAACVVLRACAVYIARRCCCGV